MRWMVCLLLLGTLPADDVRLLKTFRSEFVSITPGKGRFPGRFQVGCREAENTSRQITLKGAFEIAKYEVPQNLWQSVMGNNPSRWKGSRNSVEMVSIAEVREFCRKVTQQMRQAKLIEQNQVIRLPTEIEWEYVARAGTKTKYSFGDNADKLDDYAWSTQNAAGNDPPVGAKKPNPWGLYDVHGYLWEWCEATTKGAETDGKQTAVVRGGSWKDRAPQLRSCTRRVVEAGFKDDAVGFRCVLSTESSSDGK